MQWAADAKTVAKKSLDYIRDLDSRVRKASIEHASGYLGVKLSNIGDIVAAAHGKLPNQGILTTTPHPLTPGEMEQAVEQMARTLEGAVREEVEEASDEIAKRA